MKSRTQPVPMIAAMLLLLAVLYVGSYLALVVPRGVLGPFYLGLGSQPTRVITVRTGRHYRFANVQAGKFYWPLEQIDRRVRPGAWNLDWAPIGGGVGTVTTCGGLLAPNPTRELNIPPKLDTTTATKGL